MTRSVKTLRFFLAASAAALLFCQRSAVCVPVAPKEKSADLLASGFAAVNQIRPDTAIHCFTPLLVHAARKGLKERGNAQLTARYLLLLARCFTCDQNFPAAVQALSLAHRLDPGNQFATIYLADNLVRDGRDAEARPIFDAVKKMTPGNAIADAFLSVDKFRTGEYKQAVDWGQLAVKQKSGQRSWFVHHVLARAYARYGYKQESFDECAQAAKLAPAPYYTEMLLATKDSWQRKPLSDSSVQEGHLYTAGKLAPYDPLWSCTLANVLFGKKDKEKEAVKLYEQSVQCPRLEFKAFSSCDAYLRNRKELEAAWQCAQYITKLMPTYYECYLLQYTTLTAQEEPDKARQCLEKAVQLGPRVLGPSLQLAAVYWQNRDHDKAMQFLHHYLTLVPESASAWQRLAEYQMEIGQWEQSRHSFMEALSFMPPVSQRKRLNILSAHDLGRVCTGLGTLYYRDNDKVQALQQAELWNEVKFVPELPVYLRLFQLRPGHIDTGHLLAKEKEAAQHAELADMLFQNHQIDDAIKEYKLAAALNPDDVDYHEFLLNAMTEKGDWFGAAGEDWAVSNKMLGKIPHAISEMNKKKEPPKVGDKSSDE